MLSPKEPRTLGDIMQRPTSIVYNADVPLITPLPPSTTNVALLKSPEPTHEHTTRSADVLNLQLLSPSRKLFTETCPEGMLITDVKSPPYSENFSNTFQAGDALVCAGSGAEVVVDGEMETSAVSLHSMQTGESSTLAANRCEGWYGAGDCGVAPVHSPIKQEPCGDKERAPVTPPQKKKVP